MTKRHSKNKRKNFENKDKTSIIEVENKHKEHKPNNKSSKINMKNIFSDKRNEKWLIVLLILIAIGVSTFFRMYPSTLPITDQWAENSLHNQIANQVTTQINSQYPNLPNTQKQQLINEQVAKVITDQQSDFNKQIAQTSQYFKSQLQDDNKNTYLLAIDPYVWYTKATMLEKNGFQGDEIVDGKEILSLRNGREGKPTSFHLHPILGVIIHKIGSIFKSDFTLERAMFLLPVMAIALAIIFAFFLARKIGGTVAGFVAGLAVALNGALLGRTPAGFSDTDSYIIMGPLLVAWTFLEAMTAKTWKNKFIWLGASILSTLMFKYLWVNWWYIGSILLGVSGIYFLYTFIVNKDWTKYKNNFKKGLFETASGKIVIIGILFLIGLSLLNGIAGGLIQSNYNNFGTNFLEPVKRIAGNPLGALHVKSVARGTNIWPNVKTTVAELNAGSWKQVIASVGGKLFFTIGLLGVLLTFFLKTEEGKPEIRYATLLGLWFIGVAIMGVIASRFISILAAPFAIAFGVFFGIVWKQGSILMKKSMDMPKIATKIALVVILLLLFIAPVKAAHKIALNEVPSMNDAWYNSLIGIKNDSNDGIITSWWDFGHWFVNVAERRVTFDGGDQGKRIYWVGKSLMTEDLGENKDILRMLNCGQNEGYKLILKYTENSYLASKTINEIIRLNKDEAATKLEEIGLTTDEINSVLEKTHCSNDELLDQYYIVSQDMVGKSGVWAHFGSWDFDRSFVYNTFKNNDFDKAMKILLNETDFDENTLTQMSYEINTLEDSRAVDSWISPWPSYITSSTKNCVETEDNYECSINQVIQNQQNGQVMMEKAIIPKANPKLTKITIGLYNNGIKVGSGDDMIPKEVSILTNNETNTYELESSTFNYELSVAKTDKGIKAIMGDTALGSGAFSRLFFFDGVGMNNYKLLSDVRDFTGQRIMVYKVDLDN